MAAYIDISPEHALRARFELADTIRERIEIKREARKQSFEALARELEQLGYVPTRP